MREWGSEIRKGKANKGWGMCESPLWATGAQPCWGPSEKPCGTHGRNVPMKDKELAICPSVFVGTLLPHIWVMPEPGPTNQSWAMQVLEVENDLHSCRWTQKWAKSIWDQAATYLVQLRQSGYLLMSFRWIIGTDAFLLDCQVRQLQAYFYEAL